MKKKKVKRDAIRRGTRGRFATGCSGNPAGRPRGIQDRRVALRALLDPMSEPLIQKVIARALRGDPVAMRLCMERLIPTLRPKSEPITSPITPAKTLNGQAKAIFDKVLSGELSADDAERLMGMLAARVNIESATDFEDRLRILEEKAAKYQHGKGVRPLAGK